MADNGTNIGRAYVQIMPSAEGIQGNLESLLGGDMVSAGATLGKGLGHSIASTAVKVIGALGLGRLISAAFSEGGALQQSIGGVETLFGDAADVVTENAYKAYETAGVSANDYMQNVTSFAATMLQGLEGDTQAAARYADLAMIDMADNANKMGTSLASIQHAYQGFAKDNYTMLDNLKLGYGGTASEMARLINETKVMGDGVEYTAKTVKDVPFNKIVEAIHQVQTQLGITGTTSDEAAKTFTGSMSAMKASWKNLLADMALGNDISGALDTLSKTITTFVINNMLPMLQNILTAIPQLIEQLAPALTAIMPDLVNAGVSLVTAIISALVTAAPALVDGLIEIFNALILALGQIDWAPIGETIMNAISTAMAEHPGAFTVVAGALFLSLLSKVGPLVSSLSSIFSGFARGTSAVASAASGAATSFGQLAGQALLLVAAGAAVYVIAQAMRVLVDAAIDLAAAGPGAIGTFVLLAGVAVGVTAAIVAIGSAATVSAAGLLAMGAAVLMITGGISLVVASLSLFISKLPILVTYGERAKTALVTLSEGILALAGATAACAISVAAFAAAVLASVGSLAAAAATVGVLALAMAGLDLAIAGSAAAMLVLDGALILVANKLSGIREDAAAAGASLETMTTSVSIVEQGLSALGDTVKGFLSVFVGAFEDATPDAAAAATALTTRVIAAINNGLNPAIATAANTAVTNFGVSFARIATTVGTTMDSAYAVLVSGLAKMQGAIAATRFEFNHKIALPHFTMSGKFNAKSGSVPSVGVSWYRSAAEDMAVFSSPQVIGVGDSAQPEVLTGEQTLYANIARAVRENGGGGDITIPIYIGREKIDTVIAKANQRQTYRSGGR